jgi:hypothetical protein
MVEGATGAVTDALVKTGAVTTTVTVFVALRPPEHVALTVIT